jgi:hypothetical protein
MSDMQPVSEINTRLPSLADAEAKLRLLMAALEEFKSRLANLPRFARRLSECCDETLRMHARLRWLAWRMCCGC